MKEKKAKMGHGLSLKIPFLSSIKIGDIKVMKAAQTQCVPAPKDWPMARILFGKISEIKTHITAPCPMACEAINMAKNVTSKPALKWL